MAAKLLEAARLGNIAAFLSFLNEDPSLLDRVALKPVDNPLHIAALAGQTDGKDGVVPLHCAAMKGRVNVVKELVLACPEALREVTALGDTALHLAVKSNSMETVRLLIEELKRVQMTEIVNWKDKDGNTILHLATFRRQHQMLGLLIGEGAIVSGVEANAMNSGGFTPKDIMDLVLQNGCDVHDIHILQMFQQFGAVKSKEIRTNARNSEQNPENKATLFQSSCSWNLWRELKKEVAQSSTDTQNALMVVAVLIATVTYQATLSPPSGFWSVEEGRSPTIGVQKRDLSPGEAVMAGNPEIFIVFTIFNAIGFFASLAMISLLTSGFPLRAGLRLAILSMAGTYSFPGSSSRCSGNGELLLVEGAFYVMGISPEFRI
ncbi:hypothetical protein SLEP1_g2780 [Rubroshorea leprosula]|uniref:PGG domain-containing protein n=1 Tax=Rubroshorea leprosula TaxID=152421 RepID=A0AAV5HPT2_9ROSI|nr:hypothetical protein SLEP1_g2780 [Rubroshorea leprosula]